MFPECNFEIIQSSGGSWGLHLLENRTLHLLLPLAFSNEAFVGILGGGISSAGTKY